jgi:hypothetical protein
MADITKCKGVGCAYREECKRYTAKTSKIQSWANFEDYEYTSGNAKACDYFIADK